MKFEISPADFDLTKDYVDYVGDKVTLVKYETQPKILKKIKDSFSHKNAFYEIGSNIATIERPEVITKNLIKHFSIRSKEFKEFKPLENEIIHFKQIKMTEKLRERIEEKIKQVLNYREKDRKIFEKLKPNQCRQLYIVFWLAF